MKKEELRQEFENETGWKIKSGMATRLGASGYHLFEYWKTYSKWLEDRDEKAQATNSALEFQLRQKLID